MCTSTYSCFYSKRLRHWMANVAPQCVPVCLGLMWFEIRPKLLRRTFKALNCLLHADVLLHTWQLVPVVGLYPVLHSVFWRTKRLVTLMCIFRFALELNVLLHTWQLVPVVWLCPVLLSVFWRTKRLVTLMCVFRFAAELNVLLHSWQLVPVVGLYPVLHYTLLFH